MNRKYAWCMIGLGTMLLLAALFLVLYNMHTDTQSGTASVKILQELQQQISEKAAAETEPETIYIPPTEDLYAQYTPEETTEPTEPPTDPAAELDGRYYTGVLMIPSLQTELPVMQNWSYPNLRLSPCRYEGSAAAGDLIIAAHNYRSHFGDIDSLHTGDLIHFVDVYGTQYTYEVTNIEIIDGNNAPALRDGSDEWDLTLFTCTFSGRTRVTVRAVQMQE